MVAGAINPTSPVQINRIADQDLTGIREDPGESDIPLPLQRKINEHKPRTRASRRVYKAEGMATRGVASRPPKQLHQEPTPAGRPVLGGPSHLELQFRETKNIDPSSRHKYPSPRYKYTHPRQVHKFKIQVLSSEATTSILFTGSTELPIS